ADRGAQAGFIRHFRAGIAGIEEGADLGKQPPLDAELIGEPDRESQIRFRLVVFLTAQGVSGGAVARADTTSIETAERIAADEEAVRQPYIVLKCVDHTGFGTEAEYNLIGKREVFIPCDDILEISLGTAQARHFLRQTQHVAGG